MKDTLQYEPKHRLAKNGLKAHVERSTKASSSRAKQIEELKKYQRKPNKGILKCDEFF